MELSDRYNTNDRSEDDFDENIQEFIFCIDHCSNRSQAVRLRTHALTYIDQWRLQRLEQLDERVRTAGHLILNAFDDSLSRRQSVKCPPRSKQSLIKQPPINQSNNSSTSNDISNNYHSYSSEKTDKKIEVSINRMKSSSPNQKKIAINSIDFGRDFTFETLAHLSSPTKDMSMVLCENHTLVYSQNLNDLVILPLSNSKQLTSTQLDNNSTIHDLCYVDWLLKCIVITDENVYLLDYRTTQYDLIESGIGYICGAIDNHHSVFYLAKKSTIYKYDKDSLENLQADQYPIADGYNSRRIALDNHTNEHLALLVIANDEKNYILVYSTTSLADGYLYKVMIDDRIERDWICPSKNQGWLVQGSYPGSCFDVNMNGLGSVRVFDCNEIRNMIPFTDNERFVIRTKTDIFIFSKNTDMFMYNGYSSYDDEIQRHSICNSPLSCNIPSIVAEKIAAPYLTHIYELIISNRPFSITTDKDFKWTLEIFAFGFTCEESSIYQLCANVYVEWLKVFENLSANSNSIPPILREKTEFYWSQMFWHLYHLFVIHDEKTADLLTKRMYTHKVLRQLQIMISQTELSVDLWHILLQVFLAIGDTVLSPSYRTNEECTAVMSHRLVPSIYQVFMAAIDKIRIPPGLWRTFRDYTQTWRHRPAVVYDWAQLTCVLTSTVVHKLWWSDFIPLQYVCTETDQGEYTQKVIDSLSLDKLVITWIQFLTILQNPSECGDVSVFLQMPTYSSQLQMNANFKLKDFTSLQELPRIFVNVTKAIGMFVDIWLGKDVDPSCLYSPKPSNNSIAIMNENTPSTPNNIQTPRQSIHSLRGVPSSVQQHQQTSIPPTLRTTRSQIDNRKIPLPTNQNLSPMTPLLIATNRSEKPSLKTIHINHPTVNSLMHLYGSWILDCCLLQIKDRHSRSSLLDTSRANETEKVIDVQNERLMDEAFAKSFATICTIFGNAQCDEFIYPEYLSRFYYILQQGLRFYHGDEQRSQTIIESILLNSGDLFRINLRGINILIPLFLDAIEYYLHIDLQSYINYNLGIVKGPLNTSNSTIRDRFIRIRSKSIHILMSIISLPFHYQHLEQHLFEDYLEKSHDVQTTTIKTFLEYRLRIFPLLFSALQTEIDITNTQLLFGTIRLACSLAAHFDRQQEQNEDNVKKDPTAGYVSHAVIQICEKGTNDSQLFLAALDTLISIVTDPICQLPIDTWKNVLKRLCTFIDTQLHRSPKDHTREMHSTCVATYNTLVTLLIERPMLLDDYENLYKLCEIIELGISGEKAQSADKLVCKKDKEFHPASQRVAEAAEYLMFVLFEHKAVLHLKNDICRNWLDESTFANTTFKYFAINGNTLFAMTELPITDNHGMPTILLLCRGLFGKNIWTLNFRHNPLSTSLLPQNKSNERIEYENGKSSSPPANNTPIDHRDRSFLSHGTKTERAKSELSIPTLNSIIKRDEEKLTLFRSLKTKQISIEEQANQRAHLSNEKPQPECKPPECQTHFQSIRLFLSHYGFGSLDAMYHLMRGKHWNDTKLFDRLQPRIHLLNSDSETFIDDIKKLDQISPILHCTGHIYYLKKNQSTLDSSFSNMKIPEELNPAFLTMFSQFGSVVEVKRHCGWTGNVETSWKTTAKAQSIDTNAISKTLVDIDGKDSILYWVDLTTEMAFYLPHQFPGDNQGSEMRILIVWLEEFRDDLDSILPAQEQSGKPRDISIIGIHPLRNHLFRISLNSNAQRMQSACASIPLLDGMVIPLHLLSHYLRQAVYNLSRRKRLEDSQSSQTAYSLRKSRITKIIEKYQNQIHHPDEFFQSIFFLSTTKSESDTQSTIHGNSIPVVQL